jgi:hypothetical protein
MDRRRGGGDDDDNNNDNDVCYELVWQHRAD